ncbi:MAG: phosphoglycerate dehydrogenase-like enzyme [Myxococcota bacterium]
MTVLRWGRSAYETDAALAAEEAGARVLGLDWAAVAGCDAPPLAGVDALVVTSGVRVDAALVGRFSGSLVLTTTSGHDHIDVGACAAQGISVGRCPLARRDPVVEWSLGCLIGLMRQHPWFFAEAAAGRWARAALPQRRPRGLHGARVAVIGLGVIGRRMSEVLEGLGARVLGVDPAGGGVSLTDALREADAVSLHCALSPSSEGLIGAHELAMLRPHAVLVNSARGRVLDVRAAVAAVRSGRLAGLAVDVFPEEPWPELATGAQHPAVWFTPHAAGYTEGLGDRVAREVVAALTAWNAGRPLPHAVWEPARHG